MQKEFIEYASYLVPIIPLELIGENVEELPPPPVPSVEVWPYQLQA